MGEGHWRDDAYGGMEPVHSAPAPRFDKYLKWTWPLWVVAMGFATVWWNDVGWLIGTAAWLAVGYPFFWFDRHRIVKR
jgi:hypothetical protein